MSTPISSSACVTFGWIISAGAEPAERTETDPLESSWVRAAATCERPAFLTQTKSTSGFVFSIAPSAWAKASSRSRAKLGARSCRKLSPSGPDRASASSDSTRNRSIVSRDQIPSNSSTSSPIAA
jgi:hypothetical protein